MESTNTTLGSVFSFYKKAALLLMLGLMCACPAFAQTGGGNGSIYGRIFDADASRFMQSAEISVEGTALTTISEQGGFYVLNAVPAGEVTVIVRYAGYVTEKKTVTVTAKGQVTADFDMHLTPSSLSGPTTPAAEKKDDVILLDKLTVTTERAGNARAFMDQKNSMTMSTVLATDNFGTVQNGNIAEFLRNMPGLSVVDDGDTGEGEQIGIGGMDPKYTGVYMDGARMASGAKGGFDDSSRSFRFDQLSINGIESIEVRRTVSADMDGDAPAGGISMRTKSAFDSKKARLRYDVFFTANSYNMDLERTTGADDGKSIKIQPGFNLTYSTPFNRGTMGLLVQAGWQRDYRENNTGEAVLRGPSTLQDMMNTYVGELRYTNGQTQSERYDASIRFDWKISPYAKLQLQYGHAGRETTSFNRVFRLTTTSRYGTPNTSNFTTVAASESESATTTRISQTASYNNSDTDTVTLNFNWKRYRFTFDGNFSWSYSMGKKNPTNNKWFSSINLVRTISNSDTMLFAMRSASDKMDWSIYRGDRTSLTIDETLTAEIGQIGKYRQAERYSFQEEIATNTAQTVPTLKLDLRWEAPTKFPLWFKTGFKGYRNTYDSWQPVDANRSALRNNYQYVGLVGTTSPGKLGETSANYDNVGSSSVDYNPNVPQLASSYYLSEFQIDPHLGGNISRLGIPFVNSTLLYSTFKDHFVLDTVEMLLPDGTKTYRKVQRNDNWFFQNPDNSQNDRIASYTGKRNLSETSMSGYLMGEARPWAGWVFQAGVRYEYTSQEAITLIPLTKGQTFRICSDLGPGDEYTDKFIDTMYKKGERTTTTNSYSFMLPSAAAKYNFTPNFTAHLGYSEGFGRMDLEKLAANWKINDTAMEARAPNPSLKPDHFKTYTSALEYYFEPAGSFTLTYSFRKWDDPGYDEVMLDGASLDNRTPALQNLINLYGEETIKSFLDSNYTLYTYQAAEENDRAMQTLEFSYKQRIPAIPGLQLDASFTRIIPNWIKTGAVSAPKLATASLRYTKGNFDIRLSGNWRSRYWQSYGTAGEISQLGRLGVNARLIVNSEVSYRFFRGFTLYATASNLLNSPATQYRGSSEIIVRESLAGVSFRIGIKGDF